MQGYEFNKDSLASFERIAKILDTELATLYLVVDDVNKVVLNIFLYCRESMLYMNEIECHYNYGDIKLKTKTYKEVKEHINKILYRHD